MVVRNFIGFISPDTILQHSRIDSWALPWLDLAQKADVNGNQLVVFEVPKKESSVDLLGLELASMEFAFEVGIGAGGYFDASEIMSATDDL